MAFVFAIAMSFTTEKSVANAYINDGTGTGQPVMVTDCGTESVQCVGQFEGDDTEYDLFQDQELKNPLLGSGNKNVIITIIP